MESQADVFWDQNGDWLRRSWRGQLKSVREDDSGVMHIVWRGPLPASVAERLDSHVEQGTVSLEFVEPDAKEYAVPHAARALRDKGLAVVDEIRSREATAESEGVVIVVEELLQPEVDLKAALALLAQEYSPDYKWTVANS